MKVFGYKASPDSPRYIVETDEGKRAAYKAGALRKTYLSARAGAGRRGPARARAMYMAFDYTLDFAKIDLRRHPEHYRIGRGGQGVLLVEPYKSEILPHWRFKTAQLARQSADKIYCLFLEYKAAEDFVGMDMARKFLQMGYTRSRRYANRRSGRKYSKGKLLPKQEDGVKAESARIFYAKWRKVREDETYLKLKRRHRELYEQAAPKKS